MVGAVPALSSVVVATLGLPAEYAMVAKVSEHDAAVTAETSILNDDDYDDYGDDDGGDGV